MNGINIRFSDVLVYESSVINTGNSFLGRLGERFFDFGQHRINITKTPDWKNDPAVMESKIKAKLNHYFSLIPKGYHKLYVAEGKSNGPSCVGIALRIVLCLTVVLPLFFAYQKYQYRKHIIFVTEEQERTIITKENEMSACLKAGYHVKMLYAKLFDSMGSINPHYEGGNVEVSILNLQVYLLKYLQHALVNKLSINLQNVERASREMQGAIQFIMQDLHGDSLRKALRLSLESIPVTTQDITEAERPCMIIPGSFKEHAVIFVVYRNEKDQYSLKVVNTGFGSTTAPEGNGKVRDVIYTGIAKSDLLGFFSVICDSNIPEKSTKFYLRRIKELFLNSDKSNLTYGRVHREQQKGNCYLKCVTSWLNGRLGDDYFSFKTYMSTKSLEDAQAAIDKLEKLDLYGKWRFVFGEVNEGDHTKSWNKVKVAAQKIILKRQKKANKVGI